MRAILAVLLFAGVAAAEPAAKQEEPKKPATCKKVVVGKGLERHVVCEIEAPVVVTPPKPGVIVVPIDGRKVVGRPKSGDRLSGLSHQLR
jgi:hypothetical protein